MVSQSQNGIPTRSLYIGAAGEHYIMAECFRNQMEAFKLPIDKGFDLVATNACRHFDGADPMHAGRPELPIYLQVKSLRARLVAASTDSRPEAKGFFPIKTSDLDLLARTPNAALACVLFIDEDASCHLRGQRAFAWWHSSADLRMLADKGFVSEDPGGHGARINVVFRDPAEGSSGKQHTYLALSRTKDGHDDTAPTKYMVPLERFDFGALPFAATPRS